MEPVATAEEIEAGARQYVRKISGVQQASAATEASFERTVAEITAVTIRLLAELPPEEVTPETRPTPPPLGEQLTQHAGEGSASDEPEAAREGSEADDEPATRKEAPATSQKRREKEAKRTTNPQRYE